MDYTINIAGQEHNVRAVSFYAACERAARAHYGLVDTLYVGRRIRYNNNGRVNPTLIDYIATPDLTEMQYWLSDVFAFIAEAQREYNWLQVESESALTYTDCLRNLMNTPTETAIVLAEQGKKRYKYKYCFTVIKLKPQ